MWSNHINQLVHLKNPEYPRVFTNFEDQVGEYSVAYKKAENDFEVIAKVIKNEYNYTLIVKYLKNGLYDVINYNHAHNITEDYGYRVNECKPELQAGDTVEKGEYIYKSDNYDDDDNFCYGVNLKSVYLPWKGLTYEDGIVISESAAAKLTSFKVEKTMFSVNTNDILLNLYGDDEIYKSFPKVGDYIDSKVLVASRRRDKRTTLYELQNSRMKDIDPVNDEVIYTGGGTVVDIDVFSNKSLKEIKEKREKLLKEGQDIDIFNQEVLVLMENNMRYWKEMAEELEKIVPRKLLTESEAKHERSEFGHICAHPINRDTNPNKVTDELLYMWKVSHEYIDEKIQWRYNGKSFDNIRLQFTILKENPVTPGVKLTGRYGNKGIVSCIVPDEEMPITESGIRAEVCLNPLGVINRLFWDN